MIERTVLITGATNGVGRVVAQRLGRDGWTVLVHGRDAARGAEVVRAIEAAGGKARFYKADLASLAEVRRLADAVGKEHDRLHLLINNAGLGSGKPGSARQTSAEGYEMRFAVNYLAGFLLTHLLLPKLIAAAPSRIVNVASLGQREIDFSDVHLERHYAGPDAYRQSKLAQVLFTVDLADELKSRDIAVTALHPATYMDTFMVREGGNTPISTVDQGADAIMNLAVGDPGRSRSGEFFNGLNPARANAQAYDKKARDRLRQLSLSLTGL
jgi:NAD(P)-dependent dehydrogenase (short-subunit alcohol dehydrogenase family)